MFELLRNSTLSKNTKYVIVRDSYQNLQDTCIRTFFSCIPEAAGQWQKSELIFTMPSAAGGTIEFMFRSAETPEDVSKFRGLEISVFWLDEAQDLSPDVKMILSGRLRYPLDHPHYIGILTTNPCSVDHWLYKTFVADPLESHAYWRQKAEENKHLPEAYYADMAATFRDRPEMYRRYVLGEWGAVFSGKAAFGIGNMVQANSISSMLVETAGISTWITGPILGVFTAVVIIGGIKSIARVCEALVPFMAIFYVAGCAILLGMNASALPHTLSLIVTSAFQGTAVVGGFAGAAMRDAVRYGIARGLFSNESGLGSAPIVAAAAQTKNPVRQALVSSTGTFWDTVVVCAVTGLTIVNSGEWMTGAQGAALTKAAFQAIPFVGPLVLAVGLCTFVFSTILGWSYYGEKAAQYLFGDRVIKPYRWLWVGAVVVGSVLTLPVVWTFADIANALMAIPNLISLLVLNKVIASETDAYLLRGNLDAEAPAEA